VEATTEVRVSAELLTGRKTAPGLRLVRVSRGACAMVVRAGNGPGCGVGPATGDHSVRLGIADLPAPQARSAIRSTLTLNGSFLRHHIASFPVAPTRRLRDYTATRRFHVGASHEPQEATRPFDTLGVGHDHSLRKRCPKWAIGPRSGECSPGGAFFSWSVTRAGSAPSCHR
jgi:hypothetical protein